VDFSALSRALSSVSSVGRGWLLAGREASGRV
jgi:hypothetical protein